MVSKIPSISFGKTMPINFSMRKSCMNITCVGKRACNQSKYHTSTSLAISVTVDGKSASSVVTVNLTGVVVVSEVDVVSMEVKLSATISS